MKIDEIRKGLEELKLARPLADGGGLIDSRTALRGMRSSTISVSPVSGDELQAVIRWSRGHAVPLYPVSSGPPHYHNDIGGVGEGGTVILDMSTMKKIISINRRNRVALAESGVTFQELIPELRAAGLRLSSPLLPRAGKSAVAAFLEREPVIMPRYQWDLSDPLLCLEAVFGTGELFRTGSAAGPGTLEEQWAAGEYQKSPMGPGQNDWMKIIQGSQGSIGVATWASFKCEAAPEIERLIVASADSLEPLVESAYRLLWRGLPDICFILDRNAFSSLLAAMGPAGGAARGSLKAWNLIYSVSGIHYYPRERARYFERESMKEIRAQSPSMEINPSRVDNEKLLGLLRGVSPDPYWKCNCKGGMRDLFFQTTLDRSGEFVGRVHAMASRAGIDADDIGAYIQPQIGGRCCHQEFIFAFDPADGNGRAKVDAFVDGAAGPLIDRGAFFSRPYGAWRAPARAKSSTAKLAARVKNIFDPDNILCPGRITGEGGHHETVA